MISAGINPLGMTSTEMRNLYKLGKGEMPSEADFAQAQKEGIAQGLGAVSVVAATLLAPALAKMTLAGIAKLVSARLAVSIAPAVIRDVLLKLAPNKVVITLSALMAACDGKNILFTGERKPCDCPEGVGVCDDSPREADQDEEPSEIAWQSDGDLDAEMDSEEVGESDVEMIEDEEDAYEEVYPQECTLELVACDSSWNFNADAFGRKVAYDKLNESEKRDVFVKDMKTGLETCVTCDFDRNASYVYPELSGDGRSIFFIQNPENEDIYDNVFRCDSNGNSCEQVNILPDGTRFKIGLDFFTNFDGSVLGFDSSDAVFDEYFGIDSLSENRQVYLKEDNIITLVTNDELIDNNTYLSGLDDSGTGVLLNSFVNSDLHLFFGDTLSDGIISIDSLADGTLANDRSIFAEIGADKSCAVFASAATNLGYPENGRLQIFRWKREDKSIDLVSDALNELPDFDYATVPTANKDCSLVAFWRVSYNPEYQYEIWIKNMDSGSAKCMTCELERENLYTEPDLSKNGQYLFFHGSDVEYGGDTSCVWRMSAPCWEEID